jgi:probable HAF family extracellular repeat protein
MRGRVAVRLVVAVALTCAFAPIATASAQSSYRVVEIGTVAGFDSTQGDDINASGQVVGTLTGDIYRGEQSAFVWDPSSGLRALGEFAGEGTFGQGINDRGVVTGAAGGGHVYFEPTAFRWTAAGGFERLGLGTPAAINNAGQVIGSTAGPGWVRWAASGQVQPFSRSIYGSPQAVNDSGQIVGYAPGAASAQTWDARAGLGELPPFPSAFGAVAYDVNDLGRATGWANAAFSARRNTGCGVGASSCAVIWRDGRPTAVGPDGSYGYGINDSDHVVGEFIAGAYAVRAFLYRDGVFRDLNRLVPAGSPVLEQARAINDGGWILANGRGRAFVLIPR